MTLISRNIMIYFGVFLYEYIMPNKNSRAVKKGTAKLSKINSTTGNNKD